jgi:hypothetical protein
MIVLVEEGVRYYYDSLVSKVCEYDSTLLKPSSVIQSVNNFLDVFPISKA